MTPAKDPVQLIDTLEAETTEEPAEDTLASDPAFESGQPSDDDEEILDGEEEVEAIEEEKKEEIGVPIPSHSDVANSTWEDMEKELPPMIKNNPIMKMMIKSQFGKM